MYRAFEGKPMTAIATESVSRVLPLTALNNNAEIRQISRSISRDDIQNHKFRNNTDAIVKAFNSWSFKREQPDNAEMMRKQICTSVNESRPVSFVLYWGKGPRIGFADPDLQCLRFLAALAERIKGVYAHGVAITLIFTDTHAELNGHDRGAALAYFNAVSNGALDFNFDSCLLGDLVAKVSEVIGFEAQDETPNPEILKKLHICAQKWYGGGSDTLQGARSYYQANMIEKRAVELAFPGSIFITFNGSEFRSLFPERLPVFYMYSMKRGCAVKPWFIDAPMDRKEALPS